MTDLDQNKMDEFAGEMMQIFNSGALNLMISIGHRTGLFDAMANMAPSTSEQIAKQSGLNERYVREWLGAVTTGKIVEHIPENNTYVLPKEHAALLTPVVQVLIILLLLHSGFRYWVTLKIKLLNVSQRVEVFLTRNSIVFTRLWLRKVLKRWLVP